MNRFGEKWTAGMAARFKGREALGSDEFYSRFLTESAVNQAAVVELLELLKTNFGIPSEYLRPDDLLRDVFAPIAASTLWSWMTFQVRSGDMELELQETIEDRALASGITPDASILTFGDLAAFWSLTSDKRGRSGS